MCDQHRHKSKVCKLYKQQHQGDACYNIRIEQRNIGGPQHNGAVPALHRADTDGGQCADHRGDYRRGQCNLERHYQRVHNGLILKAG